MDYRQLVAQKVQALTATAAVILLAPCIEDEEDDEQQFFSSESDHDVIEDSHPVEGGEESVEALLHGARRVEWRSAQASEKMQTELFAPKAYDNTNTWVDGVRGGRS